MNIVCLICAELLQNEEIVSTTCGHVFHKSCLESWINSSRTCPTCRHTNVSLIKLFFEFDDQKANLQLDDILKTNDDLSQAFNELKEKSKKLEIELRETQTKLTEASANEKRLERQKQIDDMTIAGLTGIKNESMKEVVKLNQWVRTMKLDLLGEKQLRRIHQMKLHELKPDDEDYNPRSIKLDETVNSNSIIPDLSVFSSGIFNERPLVLGLNSTEVAVPGQPPKDPKPYIIPSKIQKGSKENSIKPSRLTNLRSQRNAWSKSDKKPVGFQFEPPPTTSQPSTSTPAILSKNQKRAFGEGLVFTAPLSAATANSSTATGSSFFNFSIDSPVFPLTTPSENVPTSSNFVMSTPLQNYRDVQETSPQRYGFGPKISDR